MRQLSLVYYVFFITFDGHDDIITTWLIFHIRKQPKLIALILTQGQHVRSDLKQIASLWLFNSWTFWISLFISFLYYKKTHSQGGKNCCNPQVKSLDVEHEMDRTKGSALKLMQLPSCYKTTVWSENRFIPKNLFKGRCSLNWIWQTEFQQQIMILKYGTSQILYKIIKVYITYLQILHKSIPEQ